MSNDFEREENGLCEQVNSGEITESEYNQAMKDLRDECREMAQDAANQAYDEAMGYW